MMESVPLTLTLFALLLGGLLSNGCVKHREQAASGAVTLASRLNSEIVVTEPPPRPPVEVVGPAPVPECVWLPGTWQWQNRWVWVPGRWGIRPNPNAVWVRGRWFERTDGWVWNRGYWN